MNDLQHDLQTACDALYVQYGTEITAADKPHITEMVENAMQSAGGWKLDSVEIDLHPDTDMITVKVANGLKTADITLSWRDWVDVQ